MNTFTPTQSESATRRARRPRAPAGPPVDIPTRLLVFGMVREDGTIDASELYAVAAACGMSDQQVRLCLLRIVADGLFVRQGRGKKATFRATRRGREVIDPDIEFMRFAYRQDRGLADWDGMWRMVAFAIPEHRRAARDAFRNRVLELGGAPMQGGLYVSPNRWEPFIEAEARHLDVAENVIYIRSSEIKVGGESDPARIARLLWPIDEIAGRYRDFIAVARSRLSQLEASAGRGDSVHDWLHLAIEIAVAFNRAIVPDPLLPPALLPRPWEGRMARLLLAESWTELERARNPEDEYPAFFRTYRTLLAELGPGCES